MKVLVYSLILAAPASLLGQAAAQVSLPQKRVESMDLARALLTTKSLDSLSSDVSGQNPFKEATPVIDHNEPAPTGVVSSVLPVQRITDRDILNGVVDRVTPSGTMQLGGVSILLFGQKKLKVGDVIPIEFQGAHYELQISSIERTNFTLRLNNEEIIRPIKSTSNKP